MAIDIQVGKKKENQPIKISLKIRKAFDGSILILDHEDVDIVLMFEKSKIITFPKDVATDTVYDTQSRFFKYLSNKGIVDPATIHSGNVYSSLEGKILEPKDVKAAGDLIILAISRWIETERPYFMYVKAMEEQEEERLTEPDEENSTELGKVPHADRKGTNGQMPFGQVR